MSGPVRRLHSLLIATLLFYGVHGPRHRGKYWLHKRIRKLLKVSIGPNDVKVARAGLWWLLNPADFTQEDFFWLGTYDTWKVFHILRRLEPHSVIFDIGANFGYYSLILSRALSHLCTVYSFEPNPPTFNRLRANIDQNGLRNIFAYQLGIADRAMSAGIVERPGNSGAATISVSAGNEIKLIALDEFCAEQRIARLDFVKIDVEGFEERVLEGGQRTLQQFQPYILIELNPVALARQKTSISSVTRLLREYGYQIFRINRRTLRPLDELPKGEGYIDAFCMHTNQSVPR